MPLQGIAPAHQTAESKLERSLAFPPSSPRRCRACLAAARLLILKVLKNRVHTS